LCLALASEAVARATGASDRARLRTSGSNVAAPSRHEAVSSAIS
jgi:hypothetical protein